MTKFGRCLAFYLRYWEEVEAIFWDGRADLLKDLPDSETIHRMILGVGQQAGVEARAFLVDCASAVAKGLSGIADAQVSSRDDSVHTNWEIRLRLQGAARRGRSRSSMRWQTGVIITQTREGPAAVCWIWGKGGKGTEQIIREALHVKPCPSLDDSWGGPGTVVVQAIPFPKSRQLGDEVRASHVQRVAQAFAAIPRDRYEALFSQASQ